MLARGRWLLNRSRTLALLAELAAAPSGDDRSLYLPAGLAPARAGEALRAIFPEDDMPEGLAAAVTAAPSGAAFFGNRERCWLVAPYLPVREDFFSRGRDTRPLRELLLREWRLALVLVRLGAYAIGVYRGEQMLSSKTGTGLVHGRHKKGGSSAPRFRRHREKQIETFLSRVCQHIREQLEPEAATLDYLVDGGARTTLLLLEKKCPLLERFASRRLPPLLDIPAPRRATLEAAFGRVWSSQVTEWRREKHD